MLGNLGHYLNIAPSFGPHARSVILKKSKVSRGTLLVYRDLLDFLIWEDFQY